MGINFELEGVLQETGLCLPGLNLLGHAQMIELSLGSECGGHGKCGKDRVRLPAQDQGKVNPPTALERAHLGTEGLGSGIRLACQCFPEAEGLSITATALAASAGFPIRSP